MMLDDVEIIGKYDGDDVIGFVRRHIGNPDRWDFDTVYVDKRNVHEVLG